MIDAADQASLLRWQVHLRSRPPAAPGRSPEARSQFLSVRGLRVLPSPQGELERYELVVLGMNELAVYDALTATWAECEVERIALLMPPEWMPQVRAQDR